MKKRLKIILADDHPLFRKALGRIIEKITDPELIFTASNGEEVIKWLENSQADIVFLDYSMPVLNGFDTAKLILEKNPLQKIIVLTQYDEIPVILNFFQLGVKGFLTKNADEKEIFEAVDTVTANSFYYHTRFDASIGKWLSEGLMRKIPSIKFSERDMQMVVLLSKGKTSQEISKQMGLSLRSIETYRYNLLRDLKINSTLELLNYVYKNGII